jgi:hypothetical protein
VIQKKPRLSGAAEWEESRPNETTNSLAESPECVQIHAPPLFENL